MERGVVNGVMGRAVHMPQIRTATTLSIQPGWTSFINVRSHTFNFIPPEMTDQYKIPNPCTSCHTDKTTDWARQAIKRVPGIERVDVQLTFDPPWTPERIRPVPDRTR